MIQFLGFLENSVFRKLELKYVSRMGGINKFGFSFFVLTEQTEFTKK